jgi:streptogramin lyase
MNKVVKTYPYPQGGSTMNAYETAVDKDGNVWLDWSFGDAIGKFDPRPRRGPYLVLRMAIRTFRASGS